MNILKRLHKIKYFLLLFGLCFIFFYKFFIFGKIPIPADTIVGLYHPWRDSIWNGYSAGVPYKNPLITDPVRQQYVWRSLAIEQFKKGQLPLWNPFSFSGTPLLANFQTAAFYPLNVLFFVFSFSFAWGLLVFLQPLLSSLFSYIYLRHFQIHTYASLMGSLAFAFCGFSIAWMEWNTITHTLLWLPLILLLEEKIIEKLSLKKVVLLIIAFSSSIFAGHLQVLFYSLVVSFFYFIIRLFTLRQVKMTKDLSLKIRMVIVFSLVVSIVLLVTSIQLIPTFQFIAFSARDIDQGSWEKQGWFLPWQHLVQFIAPDFFGNPTTNNYWGVWNYGEFVGYIGIIPLIFALYACIFRRDKKTFFFSTLATIGLIFALPTPIAKLVYQSHIPFFSTSQPTRLLSVVTFSLCILFSLGLDLWLKEKKKQKILFVSMGILFTLCFLFVYSSKLDLQYIQIARKNLVLPFLILIASTVAFFSVLLMKNKKFHFVIYCFLFCLVILDLFRFGWKFTSFSDPNWLYPSTPLISTIKKDAETFRILSTDRRIMASNFSVAYKLEDVSGYDPLYLKKYNLLAAMWSRGKADISPASFNRIVTPQDYNSFWLDLLGVKYVLSMTDLVSPKLNLILKEGETRLYMNKSVYPRVYLVSAIQKANSDQDEVEKMYMLKEVLRSIAVSQMDIPIDTTQIQKNEEARIIEYSENIIKIQTKTSSRRLLILTDPYYPTWQASIDDVNTIIYPVNFFFRGVVVPKGDHLVTFSNKLL